MKTMLGTYGFNVLRDTSRVTQVLYCYYAADDSAGRPTAATLTSARHIGQVACAGSHPSMHGAWNVCAHDGSRLTASPSRTTLMHTAHCSAGAGATATFRRYSNTGMASMSAWLRPPPPLTCPTSAGTSTRSGPTTAASTGSGGVALR